MLFGGSCRFTSSAASSTRSRPSHAIGVLSLVHTRVLAVGPDPEPHSGRWSMRTAPPRLWLSSHRFQATRAPSAGRWGPDGASRRCRGRGPRRPPTRPASARSWSRTGKAPRLGPLPRSRRARMSGARRSERLRTANRRTSSSTMPFAAAMSSHRWAAPFGHRCSESLDSPGGGRRPNHLSCLEGTGSEAH